MQNTKTFLASEIALTFQRPKLQLQSVINFFLAIFFNFFFFLPYFVIISAAQVGVMRQNLGAILSGKELEGTYDGYTSCPLILSPKECILAEFDFNAPPQPLETLPINQGKPRWTTAMMKTHMMPQLYWSMMLK